MITGISNLYNISVYSIYNVFFKKHCVFRVRCRIIPVTLNWKCLFALLTFKQIFITVYIKIGPNKTKKSMIFFRVWRINALTPRKKKRLQNAFCDVTVSRAAIFPRRLLFPHSLSFYVRLRGSLASCLSVFENAGKRNKNSDKSRKRWCYFFQQQ